MKLLIFAPDVNAAEWEGGSTHLKELVKQLSHQNHNLSVISQGDPDFPDGNVSHYRIPDIFLSPLNPILVAVFSAVICVFSCVNDDLDCVYARNHYSAISLTIAKLTLIPHIVEVNGSMVKELNRENRTLMSFFGLITEKSYGYSDKIVAVSSDIYEELVNNGIPKCDIVVIENGVNLDLFNTGNKLENREKIGLEKSTFCIVYVGTLYSWQGLKFLFHAVDELESSDQDVSVVVVGDGPQRRKLEELADTLTISDNVRFVGSINYEKVPIYIKAADIGFLYRKAGFGWSPLKLYEYLACGTPVIASDLPQFSFIEEENCGFLIPHGSEIEVANTICKSMHNKENLPQMGDNGRQFVENNRSWKNTANKVINVCQSVIHLE